MMQKYFKGHSWCSLPIFNFFTWTKIRFLTLCLRSVWWDVVKPYRENKGVLWKDSVGRPHLITDLRLRKAECLAEHMSWCSAAASLVCSWSALCSQPAEARNALSLELTVTSHHRSLGESPRIQNLIQEYHENICTTNSWEDYLCS